MDERGHFPSVKFRCARKGTVGHNGDFADIRGYLKGTKCYRGSWQLVLTYERDKSNGSQNSFKTFIFRGVNTIIRA